MTVEDAMVMKDGDSEAALDDDLSYGDDGVVIYMASVEFLVLS